MRIGALVLAFVTTLLGGCATAPKPPELEAFEKLNAQTSPVERARKRNPELVGEAERLLSQSEKEWQSKDLEESRRDALMGSIKLKTALALVEQDQARARIKVADTDLAKSEKEYDQLAKELAALQEQLNLLQKLSEARGAAASEKAKLAQAREESLAREKVGAAELAIKSADIVDAQTHAKVEYASAADLLARAQSELKQNNFAAASTSAELARSKAEQAAQVAKPLYERNEQVKSDKTRDEALSRDASALPGVQVRLERRGEVQRLILPLRGLFQKKATTLSLGSDLILDQVAALLKKYPTYSVHVIGHTDSRGRHDELVARSLARAQSVDGALVSRGVDDRRLKVSGLGPDEPVADNKGSGRDLNNRVEVVFILP
jgi:outer membrane protein OmpA-like peptidoglycan-associated protein